MYSKEEKKNIKIEFWTNFGVYMRKHTQGTEPLIGATTKQKSRICILD